MEKEYRIEFLADGSNDNCLQGVFEEFTVIDKVQEQLYKLYNDRLQWYEINEITDHGLKYIYSSINKQKSLSKESNRRTTETFYDITESLTIYEINKLYEKLTYFLLHENQNISLYV